MGEAFILIGNSPVDGNSPTDLSLELIAAERVETPPSKTNDPTCVLGVQKNKEDEVQGYWVRTKHPGDDKQHEYEWIYYPRLNPKTGRPRLLHVFDPLFEGQTRGIPWLASVMNRLKDVDDFHEAELIAKQIEACFGLVVTRSEDASGSLHTRASSRSSETNSDGQRIEEIEPGLIEYLETGEDIKTISPDRPGMTFQPFIETTLRTVAGALNYPYELLAKNFFQTTFASGRLALLDGFAGFKMRQSVLLDMFLTPLWKTFCFELVVGDQLDQVESNMYYADPSRYDAVTWRSKPFGFIDPEKEVRAHATGKDKEILTLAEISAQKGTDWEETQSQMEIENQRTIERHLNNLAYQRELEKQLKLEPRPYVLGDVAEEPYIEKEKTKQAQQTKVLC
jgi:lambda family phage portal protein